MVIRLLGHVTADLKRTAWDLQPASLKSEIAGGGPRSHQMERFYVGYQVGQEVTGRMHDNQHSEILRSDPQNAEEETGKQSSKGRAGC